MEISAVILANRESHSQTSVEDRSFLVRMLAGKPLISWVRDNLLELSAVNQLYITRPEHEEIRQIIGDKAAFSIGDESGQNTILEAANFIESRTGITIVMPANLPLLRADVLKQAAEQFVTKGNDALILTAMTDDQNTFERVIRDTRGIFLGTKTEDDLPPARGAREVNGGVYLFNTARLLSAIGKLGRQKLLSADFSALLDVMMSDGRAISTMIVDKEALLPVETLFDNNLAAHILNAWNIRKHVEQGVEFIDSEQTFVETTVEIGPGTVVWPGAVLTGDTKIGRDAVIGAGSQIESSQIGDAAQVMQSVIRNSSLGKRSVVGPFANLHNGAWIDRDVKIGSGADISNAIVGHGVVIDAHVLINDADIGEDARIGAGSITVNEDASGQSFRTTIGPLAMVGANASLVAPVEIEANSYIAAGSVITGNVPAFSLALARSRQTILEDWVRRGSGKREPV